MRSTETSSWPGLSVLAKARRAFNGVSLFDCIAPRGMPGLREYTQTRTPLELHFKVSVMSIRCIHCAKENPDVPPPALPAQQTQRHGRLGWVLTAALLLTALAISAIWFVPGFRR